MTNGRALSLWMDMLIKPFENWSIQLRRFCTQALHTVHLLPSVPNRRLQQPTIPHRWINPKFATSNALLVSFILCLRH